MTRLPPEILSIILDNLNSEDVRSFLYTFHRFKQHDAVLLDAETDNGPFDASLTCLLTAHQSMSISSKLNVIDWVP
jgi:hypothetical protein